MKETILEKILAAKRTRVAKARKETDISTLAELARDVRAGSPRHRLQSALSDASRMNIIAEFKRASPSKGMINDTIDVAETARRYEAGGACAISVLTEEDFFKGSLDDLREARAATSLPILRKDFIVDEFQVYESAAAGADAILLIAAALTDHELAHFYQLACRVLGIDAIVEVHTKDELEKAVAIDAAIIGVNNRDLRSFEISLDVSRELLQLKPDGATMISESGLTSASELKELQELGFDGFLIGETLMRSQNAEDELRAFTQAGSRQTNY